MKKTRKLTVRDNIVHKARMRFRENQCFANFLHQHDIDPDEWFGGNIIEEEPKKREISNEQPTDRRN